MALYKDATRQADAALAANPRQFVEAKTPNGGTAKFDINGSSISTDGSTINVNGGTVIKALPKYATERRHVWWLPCRHFVRRYALGRH